MKRFFFLFSSILTVWLASSLPAQTTFDPRIEGTPESHSVSWDMESGFVYRLQVSSDFAPWQETGIIDPAIISPVTYHFAATPPVPPQIFYRVLREVDALNAAFLTSPLPMEEFTLAEGVPFAFNLAVFPSLPARIKLFRRPWGSSGAWQATGNITDLGTVNGVKTVRGSAVWIPVSADFGDWEVKAEAQEANGTVIGLATRRITIKADNPPVITFISDPLDPVPYHLPIHGTAIVAVSDPDGDTIKRVEFYDNGVFIGTDRTPSAIDEATVVFGDDLVDILSRPLGSQSFTRGTHSITAKAYDNRGNSGVTPTPYVFTITDDTARPVVSITSPANGYTIRKGTDITEDPQNITITYTVSDADNDFKEVKARFPGTSTSYAESNAAPSGSLTFSTVGLPLGRTLIEVVAEDNTELTSYPRYLEIFVTPNAPPDPFAANLVANIVDESSVTPSNARFLGVNASSGAFTGGIAKRLEINSGVLLTTGSFASWNTGNKRENTNETHDNAFLNREEPGDDVLEDRLLGTKARDAAVLEFDAYCLHSQLEFEVQFGSEEYNEWVTHGTCYNDAFLISVNGALVSLLPDARDIVAANTVHPLIPPNPTCDLPEALSPLNEHLFVDNIATIINPSRVEYDGLTVRLRFHAFVQPQQTHHIRLAIADADDESWDSGLFIKEASVRTINP